jgi:plastocyanin
MRKALFIGALVMPALTPQAAPAQCGPYYGGRAYDSYPWSMSAYYPPMYRQSYAYTPQVYRESYDYSQPNYRQQYAQQPHAQYSHGQPSSPQSYSTARPAYSTESPTTIITVGAYDNRFEPRTINVQPGTTVRWVNQGKHAHTVTAHNQSWDSGDIAPGQSYSATFKRPGTYTYYCRHHAGMEGSIVVGTGQASTARKEGTVDADRNRQNGGAKSPGY